MLLNPPLSVLIWMLSVIVHERHFCTTSQHDDCSSHCDANKNAWLDAKMRKFRCLSVCIACRAQTLTDGHRRAALAVPIHSTRQLKHGLHPTQRTQRPGVLFDEADAGDARKVRKQVRNGRKQRPNAMTEAVPVLALRSLRCVGWKVDLM